LSRLRATPPRDGLDHLREHGYGAPMESASLSGDVREPDRPVECAAESLRRSLRLARGHFLYESGHHGDLWLDLHSLFVDAPRMREWAAELARRARPQRPEVVCGPMVGGAFLAQLVASELGAAFVFAERVSDEDSRYRVPTSLRGELATRRVLLVDDAVNAGSAWRSTLADVEECGGKLASLAALLVLGDDAERLARTLSVPLYSLAKLERGLWTPGSCPLCRNGQPLTYEALRR